MAEAKPKKESKSPEMSKEALAKRQAESKGLSELISHMKDKNDNPTLTAVNKLVKEAIKGVQDSQKVASKAWQNESAKALAHVRTLIEQSTKIDKEKKKVLYASIDQAANSMTDQSKYLKSLASQQIAFSHKQHEAEMSLIKLRTTNESRLLKTRAEMEAKRIIKEAKLRSDKLKESVEEEISSARNEAAIKIKEIRKVAKESSDKRELEFKERKEKWKKESSEQQAAWEQDQKEKKEAWLKHRLDEEFLYEQRKEEFKEEKRRNHILFEERENDLKKQKEDFKSWRKEKREDLRRELKLKKDSFSDGLKLRKVEHEAELKLIKEKLKAEVSIIRDKVKEDKKAYREKKEKSNKYFRDLKESFLDSSPVLGALYDAYEGFSGLFAKDKSEEHLANIDKNIANSVAIQKDQHQESKISGDENSLKAMEISEEERRRKYNFQNSALLNKPFGSETKPIEGSGGESGSLLSTILATYFGGKILDKGGKALGAAKGLAGKVGGFSKGKLLAAGAATAAGAASVISTQGLAKGGIAAAATGLLNPLGSVLEGTRLGNVAAKGFKLARVSGLLNLVASLYSIGDGVVNADRIFGHKVDKTDVIRRGIGGVIGFMSSWIELIDILSFGNTNLKEKFEKSVGKAADNKIKYASDLFSGIADGNVSAVSKTIVKGDGNQSLPYETEFNNKFRSQTLEAKKKQNDMMKDMEKAKQNKPAPSGNVVVDNSVKSKSTTVVGSKMSSRNDDHSHTKSQYGPGSFSR